MADKEIKMGNGREEGGVAWERHTGTFYDDKSLNEFWRSIRGRPLKMISGPTPVVLPNDKIAYTVDCFIGDKARVTDSPSANASPQP